MEDYRIYEKLGPAKYLYMSALNKINNTIKLLNLHAVMHLISKGPSERQLA